MKTIRSIFSVLLTAAVMTLSACGGGSNDVKLTLSVQPTTMSFEAAAASSTANITSNTSWTATPGADWISVSPSSGSGNGEVKISVNANTGNMRSAIVTIAAKGVTSKQVSVTQMSAGETSLVPISSESDGTKRASTTYQLLVYSFCDSNGDGIGDFAGITSKMDYFDALGVTGLWLSPIHPSSSYHAYDVTDYYSVNPLYGTEADFKAMIDAAHAHGIEIYLDYVLNHSGKDNLWFKQALADASSPYRDYYFISSKPSSDYSKFPMLTGTKYNAGEWKQATSASATLTIKKTDEAESTGNSNWNLWFWQEGKDGEALKFKDNGDGTYSLVKKISGNCGMLVRKYLNWDAGSKYGAAGSPTLKEGEALTLAADGTDINFTGNGSNYRIELANVSGAETIYYMGCFSDWMPDLNYGDLSTCETYPSFVDIAASADKWINMGVDGLRLDAVKHICGGISSWNNASNRTFLKKWYDHCNATYKAAGHSGDMFMVGEVFNEYNDSGAPYKTYLEALPSVFDFSFWWRLSEALNKYNGSSFVSNLAAQEKVYDEAGGIASLKLSNHDEDRTGEVLGKSAAKEKQAAAILLTAPGKPFIYQGEELGYYGSKGGGDEYVRTPMNWNGGAWADGQLSGKIVSELKGKAYSVDAQDSDANSILKVYKDFSGVRNTYPAMAEGSMTACSFAESAIAAWYMSDSAGNRMLVVHNVSNATKTIKVSDDMSKPVAVLGSGTVSSGNLTLFANSSVVFKLY